MSMPGRKYSTNQYRYGFNGKEDDNETGWQDYGMRVYNPKLSRFFSVDPLYTSYPWNSSYAFAENIPIGGIDLDGGEFKSLHQYTMESWQGNVILFVERAGETIGENFLALTKAETYIGLGKFMMYAGKSSPFMGTPEANQFKYNMMMGITAEARKVPDYNVGDWGDVAGHLAFSWILDKGISKVTSVSKLGLFNRVVEAPALGISHTEMLRDLYLATKYNSKGVATHSMIGIAEKSGITWFQQGAVEGAAIKLGDYYIGKGMRSFTFANPTNAYEIIKFPVSSYQSTIALKTATSMLGPNLFYNPLTNSCVTYCKKVMSSVGIPTPVSILRPRELAKVTSKLPGSSLYQKSKYKF